MRLAVRGEGADCHFDLEFANAAPAGRVEDFHLQVGAPCRAHQKKPRLKGRGAKPFPLSHIKAPLKGDRAGDAFASERNVPLLHEKPEKRENIINAPCAPDSLNARDPLVHQRLAHTYGNHLLVLIAGHMFKLDNAGTGSGLALAH